MHLRIAWLSNRLDPHNLVHIAEVKGSILGQASLEGHHFWRLVRVRQELHHFRMHDGSLSLLSDLDLDLVDGASYNLLGVAQHHEAAELLLAEGLKFLHDLTEEQVLVAALDARGQGRSTTRHLLLLFNHFYS